MLMRWPSGAGSSVPLSAKLGYGGTQVIADLLGCDPKTIQRWMTRGRTPHRGTATRAAKLLGVPPGWLWPELDEAEQGAGNGEVVGFYPHRAQVPKVLWRELLVGALARLTAAQRDAEPELPAEHPYIRVLGPVEILGATGPLEDKRLAELTNARLK